MPHILVNIEIISPLSWRDTQRCRKQLLIRHQVKKETQLPRFPSDPVELITGFFLSLSLGGGRDSYLSEVSRGEA